MLKFESEGHRHWEQLMNLLLSACHQPIQYQTSYPIDKKNQDLDDVASTFFEGKYFARDKVPSSRIMISSDKMKTFFLLRKRNYPSHYSQQLSFK